MSKLRQINGVYIPGDSELVLSNVKFLSTVSNIFQWAMTLNERTDDHFPILAVSYGYLAMIQPYILNADKYFETLPSDLVGTSSYANLILASSDTYLYDAFSISEADDMLDVATIYNEVNKGIRLGNFIPTQRKLANFFTPILTFDDPTRNQDKEFIAVLEGIT